MRACSGCHEKGCSRSLSEHVGRLAVTQHTAVCLAERRRHLVTWPCGVASRRVEAGTSLLFVAPSDRMFQFGTAIQSALPDRRAGLTYVAGHFLHPSATSSNNPHGSGTSLPQHRCWLSWKTVNWISRGALLWFWSLFKFCLFMQSQFPSCTEVSER